MNENKTPCAAFQDDLSLIVDGDAEALQRHLSHLSGCDACRDLRHAAAAAAQRVAVAGADFVMPADLQERITGALAARDQASEVPVAPAPIASKELAKAAAVEKPARGTLPVEAARAQRTWLWGAAAATVLLLVYAISQSRGPAPAPITPPSGPTPSLAISGRIERVVRAADDGQGGLMVRPAGAADFVRVAQGAEIKAGATLRTDGRTRARLLLSDGSVLVLNHGTELTLDAQAPRHLRMAQGELVADIAHLAAGPAATFTTREGQVEVLGTRFVLSAAGGKDEGPASVLVTRGVVRLHGSRGESADVRPGEEGVLTTEGPLQVMPAVDLAEAVGWADLEARSDGTEASVAGLGELRARRPGQKEDRERPLSLARHKVSVRIAGNMARTEIEEVFQNDSGDTLEGSYKFSLPADAHIERLALDVNGRLEEGAFVEREQAAKIWRGVIRHATPTPLQQPKEEFVWVPGPWRDPALLEWQRGGRFELRIFPIPAHGHRQVVLAYTQIIAPHGKGRRYVYPLPHPADASSRVGRFEADVRVAGADEKVPVRVRGYAFRSAGEDRATRLSFAQDGFWPAGDLIIDYALPDTGAGLRYWTYRGDMVAAPGRPTGPQAQDALAVVAAQQALVADPRPFVAFALRPDLPLLHDGQQRNYVLVVDSSQSMVGERFTRATQLLTEIVAQMDRGDRFTVLACDVSCRAMEATERGLRVPSSQAAAAVRSFLSQVRPAGASDLSGMLHSAALALQKEAGRVGQVIYLGDGIASVGHRRAAALAAEAEALSKRDLVRFSMVGIGGDADVLTLSAVARAGGGHYVPYVPGERVEATALSVLETTFGTSLRDVTVELPSGVTDVAPARLPTLRAGEELLVAGRFAGEVQGTLTIRGMLGDKPYKNSYPITLSAAQGAGNGFVPRLWAARMIEDLELSGRGEDRPRIVALSRGLSVLSRHTSLLVLESAAMFRAFGVQKNEGGSQPGWTGDEAVETQEAQNTEPADLATGGSSVLAAHAAPLHRRSSLRADDGDAFMDSKDSKDRSVAKSEAVPQLATPRPPPAAKKAPATPAGVLAPLNSTKEKSSAAGASIAAPWRGQWMRKVYYRLGLVSTYGGPHNGEMRAVSAAEDALRSLPDSRDRHRALFAALSRAGELMRAEEIAESWLMRDRLDPDALIALSDVRGRQGQRDESLRLLSGVVDLQPDNRPLHERLARAYERSGATDRACAHRIALAEIAEGDAQLVGAALRCTRVLGRQDSARLLLQMLPDRLAQDRAEHAATLPIRESVPHGDLVLDARWGQPVDLDLSLVTPQGTRLSFMGGRTTVLADEVNDPGRERLALQRATTGTYLIEITRGGGAAMQAPGSRSLESSGTGPADVSGQVRVSVLGSEQTLPFRLSGDRTVVGRVEVQRRFRLEPY